MNTKTPEEKFAEQVKILRRQRARWRRVVTALEEEGGLDRLQQTISDAEDDLRRSSAEERNRVISLSSRFVTESLRTHGAPPEWLDEFQRVLVARWMQSLLSTEPTSVREILQNVDAEWSSVLKSLEGEPKDRKKLAGMAAHLFLGSALLIFDATKFLAAPPLSSFLFISMIGCIKYFVEALPPLTR